MDRVRIPVADREQAFTQRAPLGAPSSPCADSERTRVASCAVAVLMSRAAG
jgi:hypothetical protein